MDRLDLEGKTAVVTGGSRGIGRAVCEALAGQGANVVLCYTAGEAAAAETAAQCEALRTEWTARCEALRAETAARSEVIQVETAAQCEALRTESAAKAGTCALAVRCDVSDAEQVKALMDTALKAFGCIDILVNNAGITRDNLMMRMKEEEFDAVIATNLKGTFLCMKEASRIMMKQRCGRIINISSVVGVHGNAGQVNYAASKAGVIGMTKSAAKELGSRGITVNAVAPGFIETDMTAGLSEEMREKLTAQIPAKRIGTAADVAQAVTFLASDRASYLTGQVLDVDGGMGM